MLYGVCLWRKRYKKGDYICRLIITVFIRMPQGRSRAVVRNWYAGVEAKYVRERAETLEREENTPSPLEIAAQETEEKMEEMYGKGSPWAELKRLFWLGQTMPPDPAVVQKLWQQALEKSKLVFLTDEIIDIRGGHRKVQGFDQRA